MALREYICRECGHIHEAIVRSGEDEPNCPQCDSTKQERLVSAHGGYAGNFGGGSTRPKGAGSFRNKGVKK